MTWEANAKVYAAKAEPNREWFDCGDYVAANSEMVCGSCIEGTAAHIAHNDPTTIALVADVVSVARHVSHYWHEEGRVDMPMRDLDKALAALDAHTKGNG